VYLDGGLTEEKKKTAELRYSQKSKAAHKLQQLLVQAEQDANLGNKMSKTTIKNMQKICRRSFELQSDMKKQLLEAAKAAGWTVVDCIG
jgi:RNase P subunit RPR2